MARKKKEKWFHPKSHTFWRKKDSAETRRRKVYASTDKKLSRYKRLVQAGRKIGSLCNVTRDPETEKKACSDSRHFYSKAKKIKPEQ